MPVMESSEHKTSKTNEEKRVTLRPFRPDDAAALSAAGNFESVAARLRPEFPSPYTLDDAVQWIAAANKHEPPCMLAICVGDVLVGGAGLNSEEGAVRPPHLRDADDAEEVGFWVTEPCWGRGIATQARGRASVTTQ